MSFELEQFTKVKITDVVVLSQKNRDPADNPGAALSVVMTTSNHALSYFDGHLKSFLFTRGNSGPPAQGSLDGVEPVSDMPSLSTIGEKVGRLHWGLELTGYELVIDHGMGEKSNLTLADCTLDRFTFDGKEGGSVVIGFQLESPDVPEAVFGKLATLKNREVQILLTAPVVVQDEIK